MGIDNKFEDLQQLNEKSSLGKLERTTNSSLPTDRNANSQRVQVSNIIFIPAVDSNKVTVKAKSKTENKIHDTVISFDNVEFLEEGDPTAVQFMAVDGTPYYVKPFVFNTDHAKVNCSCLDFYYTFSPWNDRDDSLEGDKPEPYVKKTDRPPRNPPKVPGMCKHLMKFSDILKAKRFIR